MNTIYTSTIKILITLLLVTSILSIVHAQVGAIKGNIMDNDGEPLIGVNIILEEKSPLQGSISDFDGNYTLERIDVGRYTLTASFIGYQSVSKPVIIKNGQELNIDFVLGDDALGLGQVIVTGTFNEQTSIESSVAITTLNSSQLSSMNPRNSGDIFSSIPGYFVNSSSNEVFSRINTRGLAASSTTLDGWYYNQILEDGLPTQALAWQFNNPDFYFRYDGMIDRLEALRGGSASITAPNSPGGVFGFISKKGNSQFRGEAVLGIGIHANAQSTNRIDVNFGGPINKSWAYYVGGFYRYDNGSRDIDYAANLGGQIKANLIKYTKNGYFKIYGKYLNDQNTWWNALPVKLDPNDPEKLVALEGFELDKDALMLPVIETELVDGTKFNTDQTATRNFNSKRGMNPIDLAIGVDFAQEIDGWTIHNNAKVSSKEMLWNTNLRTTNMPMTNPTGFLPYFALGYPPSKFFGGQIQWIDVEKDQVLATVDGSFLPPPTPNAAPIFNPQIVGNSLLPRNEIMISAPWTMHSTLLEFMDELTIKRHIKGHNLVGGLFFSNSTVTYEQHADAVTTTVESTPRLLRAVLTTADGEVIQLHNDAGISREGGFIYINAEATAQQGAVFLNDNWEVTNSFRIDGGLRYEFIHHKGQKDGFDIGNANDPLGGLDGNPLTGYDNATRVANGTIYDFDFNYSYLSGSLGLNYSFGDNLAFFGRYTYGNKAPQMTHYFNNFVNTTIEKGVVQNIQQAEGGIRFRNKAFATSLTGFYARLDDVSVPAFVVSTVIGLYNLPPLFNSTRTFGAELEGIITPTKDFDIRLTGTFQDPKTIKWESWAVNNPDNLEDDVVVDYSGNSLPSVPNVQFSITPTARFLEDKLTLFASYKYTGKRWINYGNAFQLPAYTQFDIGIAGQLTRRFKVSMNISNLFNKIGIADYDGLSSEISPDIETVTPDLFAASGQDLIYHVRPTLPLTAMIRLHIDLGKK